MESVSWRSNRNVPARAEERDHQTFRFLKAIIEAWPVDRRRSRATSTAEPVLVLVRPRDRDGRG
jgi:hypothetical protein